MVLHDRGARPGPPHLGPAAYRKGAGGVGRYSPALGQAARRSDLSAYRAKVICRVLGGAKGLAQGRPGWSAETRLAIWAVLSSKADFE